MLDRMPAGSKLIKVDLVNWNEIDQIVLRETDFEGHRLESRLGDLSDRKFFDSMAPEIAKCDLLFVDSPKNVVFETTLLKYLSELKIKTDMILMFDDIRQWNMLDIWRRVERPKIDATSFEHWTGTGLIGWNGKAED